MTNRRLAAALLAMLMTFAACGGADAPEPVAENAPASVEDALSQASRMIESMQSGSGASAGGAEPVSSERLAERLPASIAGFERGDVERQSTGAMGFNMSLANARYEHDDGRTLRVSITDIGGVGALGVMAAAAWSMGEFERSNSDGYERTTTFEGFRAMESLSGRSGGGLAAEINVIVADRFIVQVAGDGTEMDVIHDAARSLDLDALARER